jgi:hypothetical protein
MFWSSRDSRYARAAKFEHYTPCHTNRRCTDAPEAIIAFGEATAIKFKGPSTGTPQNGSDTPLLARTGSFYVALQKIWCLITNNFNMLKLNPFKPSDLPPDKNLEKLVEFLRSGFAGAILLGRIRIA